MLYGQSCPGAVYNQTEHAWRWPSGARIEFGHMHYAQDRFKYRGRQFAYIGWDELTLWPDDVPYVYLGSRLRSPGTRLKCFVRATTNPDGAGQTWVKNRWAIANDGKDTSFNVMYRDDETGKEYQRSRRFIRATLDDNPHLSETDYRIQLLSLPPEEREALLRGRWDALPVRGAYYAEYIAKMRREGRISRVPHQEGLPVDTWWDLGHSDTTAILFHQQVGLQDRIIKGYENSGESLAHYVKVLTDLPYIYGTHYLPHDAGYVRLGQTDASTKSWRDMLQELLPTHRFEIVPRIEDVTLGIQQTRNVFGSLWMDDIECAGLVTALENYRKKWNDNQQVFDDKPLHDWSSNYADALRQLGQWRAERQEAIDYPKPRHNVSSWKRK